VLVSIFKNIFLSANLFHIKGIKNRFYSTISTLLIDPNYISGLTQSDGSFFVVISKNSKAKLGLRVRPTFTITQDLDSISVLEEVQKYFNCGKIYINQKTYSAEYVVNSLTDLQNIIIPHFYKYPVFLSKEPPALFLVSIVDILTKKEHYNKETPAEFIKLVYSMNDVTNRTIEREKELFSIINVNYYEESTEKPNIIDHPLNDQF